MRHFSVKGLPSSSHNVSKNLGSASYNSLLRFKFSFLGIHLPTPSPSAAHVWCDQFLSKNFCSALRFLFKLCSSVIQVSVTITIVSESSCWSKFDISWYLFCMLRALKSRNLMPFWAPNIASSKVESFEASKGPGFFSMSPERSKKTSVRKKWNTTNSRK